jgi:hypothetical protein
LVGSFLANSNLTIYMYVCIIHIYTYTIGKQFLAISNLTIIMTTLGTGPT